MKNDKIDSEDLLAAVMMVTPWILLIISFFYQ